MSDERKTEERRPWPPATLLVGFDGSDGSGDAVALAAALGGAGATVVLVNVMPATGPLPTRPRLLDSHELPEASEFFAPARAALEGFQVETRTYLGGSAARVLTEIAEDGRTDVVVVGSTSRSAVGRAVLGSTARGLMYGAAAPALVAPSGYASADQPALRTIAVAYDGTSEAKAALQYGKAAALAAGGTLRVLTVATRATTPAGMLGYKPPMPKTPGEVLAEGVAAVGDAVAVEGRELGGGGIPEAIVRDSAEDVDLFVVGSRGYGAFSRVMIGSVADGLIHQAACPVIVVPRPGRAEFEGAGAQE